jgi:hypothetical protein
MSMVWMLTSVFGPFDHRSWSGRRNRVLFSLGLRERSPYSDYADIALIGDCAVLFAKRAMELYLRPSFLNILYIAFRCIVFVEKLQTI